MYEQSFQLKSRPFTSTPFTNHYFPGQAIQKSLASARLCIDRGSGPVIVVGEVGTGKSLLLAMLEEQYRTQFSVVNLVCSRLHERQELLQSILFELQLPYRNMSEGELRLSLMDYLKPSHACPNGALLLIDEAQNLPVDLLDEIRLITNYVRNGQLRVRLVMAGDQRLEEQLADSKLESFNQRIAARCYLTALSQSETADYVVTHIDRAGGGGKQMFAERSLRAIHELTEGCPRFINQLCEHALILAATNGRLNVDESLVREAWADVQSLPGTIGAGNNRLTSGSTTSAAFEMDDNWTVIEFGSLDDEDQKSTAMSHNPFGESTPESLGALMQSSVESLRFDDFVDKAADPNVTVNDSTSAETNWEHSFEPFHHSNGEPQLDVVEEFLEEAEPLASVEPQYQQSAASSLNPFAESFDEEEQIHDRYAPLIAACNQASLRLSSEQLSCLKPLDQQHQESLAPETKPPRSSHHFDQTDTTDSPGSVSHAEKLSTATQFHSHPTEAISTDVERQVAALISSLDRAKYQQKTEVEPVEPVSHETGGRPDGQVFETLSFESQIVPTARVSFGDPTRDVASRTELDSLQEVIEQQNRAAATAFGGTESEPETVTPVPVIAPTTRKFTLVPTAGRPVQVEPSSTTRSLSINSGADSADDSDIIVINREEQSPGEPIRRVEPIPFPATPVSTGQAQRMDYQQLFEQLRNMPGD